VIDFTEELSVAPTVAAEHAGWIRAIRRWRDAARTSLGYGGKRYALPESTWTQSAFVCGLVMLWEEAFFDPSSGEFLVEDFLDVAEREYGGLDALILWHAYPRIGFDDRNQFDFYRGIPGGLDALADIVGRLHRRGVRAVLDYNPWDTDTRPEGAPDEEALAKLVKRTGADAIFLDTLARAEGTLLTALDAVSPGIALQSELDVPLDQVANHALSWVQWPKNLDQHVLLRNKWFEPRQMQHLVRRWHESHRDELLTAWINGTGVVVWENVFGSWYPWSLEDKALLGTMRRVQRPAARFFSDGDWNPYVPTSHGGLSASSWHLNDIFLWTFANRSDASLSEPLSAGSHWVDLLSGRELDGLMPSIEVPGGGIACAINFAGDSADAAHQLIEEVRRVASPTPSPRQPAPPPARVSVLQATAKSSPDGWHAVSAGDYTCTSTFRLRECGDYERARLEDSVEPDFSPDVAVERNIHFEEFALAPTPVSNEEYDEFLRDSGYRPADSQNFLRSWIGGTPDDPTAPVTWVDLTDARAYCRWAGTRLPTEDEWQVAMAEATVSYGSRRVWEWTESEYTDGHTRFAILKGGSDLAAANSHWYAERGPLAPDRSAKFLLFHPGLDRSSVIGFRCAITILR